ncbi:ATP-binding protein, partial [Thermobifida fusca]
AVYQPEEVRDALSLDPQIPVLLCDARVRESCKEVLITLIQHLQSRAASTV